MSWNLSEFGMTLRELDNPSKDLLRLPGMGMKGGDKNMAVMTMWIMMIMSTIWRVINSPISDLDLRFGI